MLVSGCRIHRIGRRVGALGPALACSAAAAAGAATLKVSVPAHLHNRQSYTITVKGSYKPHEVSGKAYLIALIQYSSAPCQPTVQLEKLGVRRDLLQFYLAPPRHSEKIGIFEHKSPFTREDPFSARSLGVRHVCAYLYQRFLRSTDSTAPIARADSPVSVTKR